MKTSAILLVFEMILVVSVFFAYTSGFVVVNAKAVPRVEVRTVSSGIVWNDEQGNYNLAMPNLCGLSDEEVYQNIIRLFPNEEAYVNSLSLDDLVFMMPEDNPYWLEIVFKHWQRFGTLNVVFYNALVAKKQFRSWEDAEEFIRNGGL